MTDEEVLRRDRFLGHGVNGTIVGTVITSHGTYVTEIYSGPIGERRWHAVTESQAIQNHLMVQSLLAEAYRFQALRYEAGACGLPEEIFGDYLQDKGRYEDATFWLDYDPQGMWGRRESP